MIGGTVTSRVWKIVAAVAVALIVATAGGWLWGSQGRWAAERELARLQLDHELTGARARLLAARVELYALNFGSAAANFEAAKQALQQAQGRLAGGEDQAEVAAALQAAIAAAEEGGRFAAEVNPSAQAGAERALAALERAESRRSR